MIAIFMLALVGLTSGAAYLLGARRLGLEPARLGAALGKMRGDRRRRPDLPRRADLLVAVVLVVALRGVTGTFVSVYVTDDACGWASPCSRVWCSSGGGRCREEGGGPRA